MPQTPEHVLLSRINEEIRGGAVEVSDLSGRLQGDIGDTITDEGVKKKGLRSIHAFLLLFIPASAEGRFEWPK